ncbi:MAG: alkaline phosphatase family protein [Rhodocyclaceae bacterium]|nr:alkaline phosphatase family protein [Rhodocyclaceae bacterium]
MRGYKTLTELFGQVEARLRASTAPAYLYAYYAELDTLAHIHGVGSDQLAAQFALLDAAFGDFLAAIADTDTVVLACADHGFIDSPPSARSNWRNTRNSPRRSRARCAASGAWSIATSSPTRETRFVDYVQDVLGECADLFSGSELIAQGWFGRARPIRACRAHRRLRAADAGKLDAAGLGGRREALQTAWRMPASAPTRCTCRSSWPVAAHEDPAAPPSALAPRKPGSSSRSRPGEIVLHDDFGPIGRVAGVDVGFEDNGGTTRAAVAVLGLPLAATGNQRCRARKRPAPMCPDCCPSAKPRPCSRPRNNWTSCRIPPLRRPGHRPPAPARHRQPPRPAARHSLHRRSQSRV